MAGIFDRVKSLVDIRDYIQAETGMTGKKVGAGTIGLSQCPFPGCNSKKGFRIDEPRQYFKCFSCDAKGDVIEFEQRYHGRASPLEAANSIADKRGIPVLDSDKGNEKRPEPERVPAEEDRPAPPAVGRVKKDEPKAPGIEQGRAREIRKKAAGFYHARLLADKGAVAYQTGKRGHDIETIKDLQVGLGGGNLIGYMKDKGISAEELSAVGLVRKRGRGYGVVIKDGLNVYPHFKSGDVLFFSLKDPAKKVSYQLQKIFVDPEWLCYGQDALGHGAPVVVVEGENDLLGVRKCGYDQVMATIGAYNEGTILEYLRKNSKDRAFYLCFDRDPPVEGKEGAGARYTRKYANAILDGGGKVKVIGIAAGENGGKRDIDDILREAEDPAAKLRELMKEAMPVTKVVLEPGEEDRAQPKKKGPVPPAPPEAYKFKSFQVLGELGNGSILFWSLCNKRLYTVSLRDLNLDQLVQVGGIEVAAKVARGATSYKEGNVLFQDLKKRIIVEASKNIMGTPEYWGQGIHWLKAKKQLLVVVGGQAWVWDGRKAVEWKHPLIAGKLIQWAVPRKWIDFGAVQTELAAMDRERAAEIREQVFGKFYEWGFTGSLDVWLLVGWVLAQYLQLMWSWRPHIWMTGSAGSGKTLMNELIGDLGGGLAMRCEGQNLTEPGLRQSIGDDSCLILIDEIESSKKREAIISFIRSAGRSGGKTRKGGSDQNPINAEIDHMVFMSSIERGVARAAEVYRYLPIETVKSDEYRPTMPGVEELKELRAKIMAYVLWAAFPARKLVVGVGRMEGYDFRFVESLSVAFSMIAVVEKDGADALSRLLSDYLKEWGARNEGGALEDEGTLLQDILMAGIQIEEDIEGGGYGSSSSTMRKVTRTVSHVVGLKDSLVDSEKRTLEAHGLKVCDDGLFIVPGMAARALLKGTPWYSLNIKDILMRIQGADGRRRRVSTTSIRGVLIPWYVVKIENEGV